MIRLSLGFPRLSGPRRAQSGHMRTLRHQLAFDRLEERCLLATTYTMPPAAFPIADARSVQQLRETMIEVQIAPVRSSVHIPVATLWAHYQGGDVNKGLAELDKQAQTMIDDLLWWTTALKAARKEK